MANLYPIQIVDIYPDNSFNAKAEKEKGTKGVIFKGGQGGYTYLPYNYVEQCESIGFPYGFYWVLDSRYAREYHIAEIKRTFSSKDFGQLGFWFDCEKPMWTMDDNGYYKTPYAGSALIEGVTNDFLDWCGQTGGLYTSPGFAKLVGWNTDKFKSSPAGLKLAKLPLWAAQYNNSITKPDLFGAWTEWMFWQYRAEPDYNYFNGDETKFNSTFKLSETGTSIPVINTDPAPIKTHEGIVLHTLKRFGTNVFVHAIDPKKAKVFVTPRGNFGTVKGAITKYNAQVGVNGGGWPQPNIPQRIANEVWVSDGEYINTTVLEYRGFINISKDGTPLIHETNKNISDLWNCWGFDRILVANGVFNTKISDRITKDARTGTGVTADGQLILLSAEGNDYYQRGLSFPEMASILIEFGSVWGGNNDGGSSSQCINTAISPNSLFAGSDGADANVINHVLVSSTPLGVVVEPDPIITPPKGETNKMKYKVILPVKARLTPSMYQVTSKTVNAGTEFNSDMRQIITERIPLVGGVRYNISWLQMPDAYWIPMSYKGVEYVSESTVVEPPVVVDPIGEIITRKLEIDTTTGKVRIDGGAWE